jgi:hypothetical protein
MPKINYEITSQAYEIVRNRVFDILLDELTNQETYDPIGLGMYAERSIPSNSSECPMVNVSLATVNNNAKQQGQHRSEIIINIDCYDQQESTVDARGDFKAKTQLQKILGKCRYILNDPQYKTLGFVQKFINTTYTRDLVIFEHQTQDIENIQLGRLTFVVVCEETNALITANLIEGYQTKVRLEDSEKGFFSTTP